MDAGHRGEEAIGVVLDLVPPGATRLPLCSRLDLIRAGVHARRRGTPPLGIVLRYAYGPVGLWERSPTLGPRPRLVSREVGGPSGPILA